MSRPVRLLSLTLLLSLLAAVPAAQAAKPKQQYLLSLGDSYSVGYQADVMRTTHNGPADQLVPLAAKRGYRFKLVNLGCGGATTGSMLTVKDCVQAARAPGAAGYPGKTQVQAAVAFIKKHKSKMGLVTVSISGNDVTGCIPAPDPFACTNTAMKTTVKPNLAKIVKRLRAAGGKHMRIVGSTYPDVVLGAWVHPEAFPNPYLIATNSLSVFKTILNPGLKKTYASVGAKFVDVTRATGAYGPFTTVATKTYGRIPQPVATACRLTSFCSKLNIHMTTPGYRVIAKLEAATLPRRHT